MHAICIPAFDDSDIRHGGVKRSNQIREVLSESGFSFLTFPRTKEAALRLAFRYPHLFAFHVLAWLVRSIFLGLTLKGVFYLTAHAIFLHRATRKGKPDLIALELSAGHNMLIGRLIWEMRVPYICLPQNVEFLVPNQRTPYFRNARQSFEWEREAYRHAHMNFAISNFDASVIASLGANATVLWYYPIRSDAERFSRISTHRKCRGKSSFFLILGTVHNPPTRIGMEALLRSISSKPDISFIVAGFGTEELSRYESRNIQILGGVTDDILDNLLRETEGVVISQIQTSGFLTRIVDLNLCSVPIYFVTQYLQGRNLEDHGVFFLENLDSLRLEPLAPPKAIQHFRRPSLDFSAFTEANIIVCGQ